MKHLKVYETFEYGWINIYKNQFGELCIKPYSLASEMEQPVKELNKNIIRKEEKRYYKLVKELLIGKVVSFDCADCNGDRHVGVCDDVEFHSGFDEPADDQFQFSFIQIKTEDREEAHSIEDEDNIIILNVPVEEFRIQQKYNL